MAGRGAVAYDARRMKVSRVESRGMEARRMRRIAAAGATFLTAGFAAALIGMPAAGIAVAQSEHGQTAQHGHHAMKHKIATGVKLTSSDDPTKQTLTLRLGPVKLPANSDHMAMAQPADKFWGVAMDGWVVAFHPRLVDAAGQAVPGRVLHHVAFWHTGRSDFLCPNKEEHIFGAGGEMNDWPAVEGFGYRVLPGDRIRIETMFHNPTEQSYPETYLEVRLEYRLRSAGAQLKSVYPAWFDVMECRDSGYTLAPGQTWTSGEISIKRAGMLLGVGGHMHDYGEGLFLENLTRNEKVAELRAQLDAQGRIVTMPMVTFYERGGYRLKAGERLKTTAEYSNPTGKSLPDGAMGIVVGYFLPDDDAAMASLRRKPAKRAATAARSQGASGP